MAIKSNAGQSEKISFYWKRRPSEIRGYNRTIYTTTDDDEYIRVDYNLKEKRIRLYLEDSEEGGNPYYSVITNGKITVERNATSGRMYDLNEKFAKRAAIFSSIPNKEIVRLINKNYGITLQNDKDSVEVDKRKKQRNRELDHVRRKYFANDENISIQTESIDKLRRKKKRSNITYLDLVDTVIGVILCAGLYFFTHNFVTLGVLSGLLGIFLGLLDVYYREREIKIFKMLLFLLAGLASYIYGYYII